MKLTMRLTLDGLVRAMRARAHEAAEAVESGARREDEDLRKAVPRASRRTALNGGEHDRGDA